MTERLINIPFSGFYHSTHSEEIDWCLSTLFDLTGSGDPHSDLLERATDSIDWSDVYEGYAREYAECLASELDLDSLKFESLSSPRYYNYETDRIFATINSDDIRTMHTKTLAKTLERVIKERFTSCSGFIPHYSNDIQHWWDKGVANWDHNELGTLMIAYWIDESNGDEICQFDELGVMPDCRGWLYDLLAKGSDLERFLRVAEYLDKRTMRAA